MTTSKICGIAEIRTAKAATTTTASTTAHFKCAISNFVVGRAGKNETEVFLLHLVVPSLPSFPSLQCRVVVSLQNTKNDWWPWKLFRSVGRLELFTRKDSTPLHSAIHCIVTTTSNVFRPKRGASPPKLLARSERKKTHPPLLEHEIWREGQDDRD